MIIDRNPPGETKLVVSGAKGIAITCNMHTIGSELLHPFLVFQYKDVAITVDIDAVGVLKTAICGTKPAPLCEERSLRIELLNPMIEVVGDIDIVLMVNSDTVRILEFTVSRPVTAEGAYEIPILI